MLGNAATLIFIVMTFTTAAIAVVLTTRLLVHGAAAPDGGSGPQDQRSGTDVLRRYRFREGYMLSDVEADDGFLDPDIDRSFALQRLVASLSSLSPDLADSVTALQERGDAFLIDGHIGSDAVFIAGRLEGEDVLTLSIGPAGEGKGRQAVESAALTALQSELSDLRAALDAGAVPMWREDESARVTWANAAYFELVERLRGGEAAGWPLPRIFMDTLEHTPSETTIPRCKISMPDRDEPAWYEISRDPLPGGTALFTAQPVDRLVQAETNLRELLQTTAKTFAALPVGLAVFDRKRRLVTFNPALVALTQVGPTFLSARPDLKSFLDQLRENKRMPEPRDYLTWRDEIAQLEQGAEHGTYCQLWELPEGKTFRVMGRPHPDGAIAFMFEDISAEVSRARQLRADLEMFQAVLDAVPAAIAVFQANGAMIGSNEGYGRLWGPDPQILEQMPHLDQAMADWSAGCKPSDIWGTIRQFVGHEVTRTPWVDEVETTDGTPLAVRVAPTRGRATVVQFLPLDAKLARPPWALDSPTPTPLLDTARAEVKSGAKRRA